MNAQIIAAAILVHLVRADFAASISTAGSLADSLSSQVNGWSSPDGLLGALAIQSGFGGFSDAIIALSSAGGSISDSDVDPSQIGTFATSVANLLNVLTAKAGDFSAVQATSIVSNDIQQLGGPAAGILGDIISAASTDCPKVSSLSGAYSAVVNGFSSADAAYSIANPSFPAFPSSCSGGASSAPGSSAPASSAPASSAPASSAPGSSAPASSAPASSAPASSAPGSSAPASSAAASSAAASSAAASASSVASSASAVASSAASAASSAASAASSAAASGSSARASSAPASSAPVSSSVGGGVGPIGGNTSTPVPPVTTSPGGPIINGTSPGGAKTTTVDTTKWVTIPCSTPTTVTYGGSTYTVTKATTLTVKDCGCTDTVPGGNGGGSSSPLFPPPSTGGTGGFGGAPSGPAVASTKPGNPTAGGVPIANKGFQNAVGLSAGVAGIVALLI